LITSQPTLERTRAGAYELLENPAGAAEGEDKSFNFKGDLK